MHPPLPGACLILLARLGDVSSLRVFQEPAGAGDAAARLEETGAAALEESRWSPDSWVVPRQEGQRAYFDIHIPKTAGISFLSDVKRFLPPGQGYFSREACFEDSPDDFREQDVKLAFFRSPASHVQSQFLECKYDKFFKRWRHHEYDVYFTNISSWLTYFNSGHVNDFRCYHPENMQTRALTCHSSYRYPGCHHKHEPMDFGTALSNLQSLYFVGIVEMYQESLCLFHAKLHNMTGLPGYCNCKNKTAWARFHGTHYHHSTPRHSVQDLSHEDLKLISNLTALDTRLYWHAKQRFVRELQEVENVTGVRILCDGGRKKSHRR
mmetsp:Transcript_51518/g.149644  ORF Transcript_51518/g.149644 Transcript_51518/m.149644 type:complete len:323 (-) Transcript_51518:119-1087(-)